MKKHAFGQAGAIMALAVATQAQAAVVSTTSSWNGTSAITSFGELNTATYGQTFTTPGDNVLNSFTFFLNDGLVGTSVPNKFRAYVAAWDGVKAGSVLFESGDLATSNNGGLNGFEAITVNTGGLSLTTGSTYVAFFSATKLFDGVTDLSSWGFVDPGVYSGGAFVYSNNGSNFSLLSTQAWDTLYSRGDLAFTLNFSQERVPEPSSLALLGVALAGLGWSRRKRSA